MREMDKRFEMQAQRQKGLRALPWPEKVRMAERVRESLVRWKGPRTAATLVTQIRRLAWDVEFSEETLALYPEWTLQRVLEYGQWEDFEALARFFGPQRLRELLGRVRCATPRARSFCEVLCA
jgi:hypothetical protein